ncbi:MAG TPA: 50S ribosomal protein L11 methyltransferase [Polyangiaceae bacterium]|nr:50S ribosomal protein L11 methyltransferase [Polyangiaceae bacterium]
MIDIPPIWRVVRPLAELIDSPEAAGRAADLQPARTKPAAAAPPRIQLVISPGAGFGRGDHETTQLCLQAVHWFRPPGAGGWRMLDFGSGSGILAVAAAKLGASVEAVEIDDAAIAHAERNACLNGVQGRILYSKSLEPLSGVFELVVGNILLEVLLAHAEALVARVAPGGRLVLSGLVATDVPAVIARYAPLLDQSRPDVYERAPWRLLTWRRGPSDAG